MQHITNVNLLTVETILKSDQPYIIVRGNNSADTFKIYKNFTAEGEFLILASNDVGCYGWTTDLQDIKDFCNR